MRFYSFGQKHSYSRCDAITDENLCDLCATYEKLCKQKGNNFVSPEGCAEYDITQQAVMARQGVKDAMQFWSTEGKRLQVAHKLHKNFPYFSSKAAVNMLFHDYMVIFADGKKRSYMRTTMQVNE